MVIPFAMTEEIKGKLHPSHLGVQACLRRAREAFYWPAVTKNIQDLICKCSVCNTFHQEQKEQIVAHPIPSRPWESITTAFFEFQGRDYLVTTDCYSNVLEVNWLVNKTSKEVISKLKSHMARHGIPNRLISDNGSQFSSKEFQASAGHYEFQHVTSSPGYP